MKTLPTLFVAALILAGCTTTKLVENPPGSGKYDKVVEVDPKLKSALDAAKQLNDGSALFNPYSGAIAIVLGATTALAEWRARRKNDLLRATIAGVEAKGGTDVKEAIKSAAMTTGVEAALNKAVKSVTG
jgi:hypothetical protein